MICPWPDGLFPLLADADGLSLIDKVGVSDFSLTITPAGQNLGLELLVFGVVGVGLPGLSGWQVLFNAAEGGTSLSASLVFGEVVSLSLDQIDLTLRAPPGWFVPVDRSGKDFVDRKDPSGTKLPFDISLTQLTVTADSEGNLHLSFPDGAPGIRIGAFRVEGFGLIIEDALIRFVLSPESATDLGFDQGLRGLYIEEATVHLPADLLGPLPDDVTLNELFIGSAGISGSIRGDWSPVLKVDRTGFEGAGATFYGGFAFALVSVQIELDENIPVFFEVRGQLLVPWFEQVIEMRAAVSTEGRLSWSLSAVGHAPLALTKDELCALELLALDGELLPTGLMLLHISGRLQPLLMASQGVHWPAFEVERLLIDSEGKISIGAAWLDLKELATLDPTTFVSGCGWTCRAVCG
jgi:hypothetical protein